MNTIDITKLIKLKERVSGGASKDSILRFINGWMREKTGLISAADRWNKVDWDLPDATLANKVGVSREYVRQVRKRLNKTCANKHVSRSVIELREFLQGRKNIERTAGEIAAMFKTSGPTVKKHADLLGVKLARPVDRRANPILGIADYRIPDKVLEKIWGVFSWSFANYRSRCRKGSARWRGSRFLPCYNLILSREIKKARKFKNEQQ